MARNCRSSLLLIATTALATSSVAHAAHKHAAGVKVPAGAARAEVKNSGQSSTQDNNAYVSSTSENVSVQVRRRTSGAVETISQKLLSQAPAGTNPMKVLGQLPGIMFQSDDPQGLDNWSIQILMHGFQQQELGMTLDGMPLGELAFRNYNGLNAVQAISAENVQRIDVSQSAGAEEVAATNNLGGSLAYVSSDPKSKRGGTVKQSFGSYDNFHTFIRFDSGDLNHTGTKFYVSYMRNDARIWKGVGENFNQQVNAKFVQPIGADSRIAAFFDWSDIHQMGLPDASPEVLQKVGYNVPLYYNGKQSGLQAAINAAHGIYPKAFAGLVDPLDSTYYDTPDSSTDKFGGIKADIRLNDHATWNTTAYGHSEEFLSNWSTPYFPSPNGSPLSSLGKRPTIQRFGVLSQLHYTIAHNDLGIGGWYENDNFVTPMYVYSLPNIVDGKLTAPIPNPEGEWKNPFAKIFSQHYNTNSFTAFVNDTYHITPNLALHAGFKSILDTSRVGDGYLNPDYYGAGAAVTSGESLTTAKAFLPHVSADWHFLKHHELYVDISENVHAYPECGYKLCASPLAVSQEAFNATRGSLRPETAWTYAGGYRYNSRIIGASLYAYHTNFNNRLQQLTSGSAINPISTVANVGGVTMNGVDAALTVVPVEGLSFTNSVSYNHAVYDRNVTEAGVSYHLKDVQVVNYPKFMYKTRLSYETGPWLGYIDASYTGARNYTYTGDVKVDGYWLSNLGVQYLFAKTTSPAMGFYKRHNVVLAFNVANLADARYISTVGENGNPLSIGTGALAYQSFLPGAPRMFFGNLSTDF